MPRVLLALLLAAPALAQTAWDKVTLSQEFTCEGAAIGDIDHDGHADVVAGPWWHAGPEFTERHALYEAHAFDPHGYSDAFFAWTHDVDQDGALDVVVVGFPGKEASWLRNPGLSATRRDGAWKRLRAFDGVDNESPAFVDLVGDDEPELVFHTGGRLGWASPDPDGPWTFHPISADLGIGAFQHGLGVGDVDGDGKRDVLLREGWWRQPESLDLDLEWERHDVPFGDRRGGAQMQVYDVDGDEDADVVTSLDAHGWGLSWFEQVRDDGEIAFREHRLMDDRPTASPHGARFSELHAMEAADVDGDGLLDVVTGKRWWAHGPEGDPEGVGLPVVVAFLLRQGDDGVDFVPLLIDDDSGVGTQIAVGDADGDGRTDVLTANKRGAFVHLQREASHPNLGFERGDLTGWTAKGEAFARQPIHGDTVAARDREPSRHAGASWIGGYELLGDEPTGTLTSDPFRVTQRWASFLVGGGADAATRVELVRDGEEAAFFRTSGGNFESMQRVVVDLEKEAGRRIRIRIVDEHTGGWGHINFDDFRFHRERPDWPRDPQLPLIAPVDSVKYAGLPPADAAKAMTAPEGFRVDLVAAEPDVHQPIALAIDAKGRLWVAEAHSYPARRPEGRGKDAIVVFEDRDADGSFETRTVFAKGLNLVSGLEVGFGGAWVGAAPYLLFLADQNDDLVPDGEPEVVLDGWGYQDTHETLNAFTWGPDGWLYGCHGVFTYSRVGKPGTPDSERVPIDAGVWRVHPIRREFEVFAHGTSNPWGVDFDAHGQAFITACVIPHLWHVIPGAWYQRQAGGHGDPHVYQDLQTIADHVHYVGPTPHGGNLRSGDVGGGHAHCGALVYLADAFPEAYRGTIFMGNIHGNRLNNDALEPKGSGFVGRHRDDFLLSNDRWFRAIALRQGPDGAIYLADWYDKQACHDFNPGVWDRTNGRVYRVSYGEPRTVRVDLPSMSDDELVGLQAHENDWWARRACVVLQERGSNPRVHAALGKGLAEAQDAARALRYLWALHATGGLTEDLALAQLASRFEHVQAWAVQLLLERRSPSPRVVAALEKLAAESPSPVVRLYLASGLQRMPVAERWGVAGALLARAEDASDANLPLLEWYGVEPLVAADSERAAALRESCRIPLVAELLGRRAAEDASGRERIAAAIAVEGDPAVRARLLRELARGLEGRPGVAAPASWPAAFKALAKDDDVRVEALWVAAALGDASVAASLRAVLEEASAPTSRRERAIDALVRLRDAEAVPLLQRLLGEAPLRTAALRALARFDDEGTPSAVLAAWPSLPPDERRVALRTLASRVAWARALLAAVEAGTVAQEDVDASIVRALSQIGDEELDALIRARWGVARDTAQEKRARIEELRARLTEASLAGADLPRGREVFSRTCMQCHTLFGAGGAVGPDLTGANRADLGYVLENVIDPSATVGKDYLNTIVRTLDGQVLSGIQRQATDAAITLVNETGTVTISRSEIEVSRLSEVSAMPNGLLEGLTEAEVRDLVAYLRSAAQVPILATARNAGQLFNGKDLTGWSGASCWSVEGEEIVGRSTGLAKNEFLVSCLEVRDFSLTLDVRLVGDQGNSGVQFRSRVLDDGDLAGCQADIGPGWWGKLYEEHGRGLLWDKSGEEHVARDGWNTYEIVAEGGHVRTLINGKACVDLEDADGARAGVIALQLHSGDPTEVRFRNLRLDVR
ncbi:MAG: PVC-type heme-binding CxxCH protein [Planctomycetota bacterium]